MELSYKTKKLERSFTTDKGLAKAYGVMARKVAQRKRELESAENLWQLSQLKALRLHQHTGSNKGIWSIDIQKNWRILFRIDQDPVPGLESGGVDLEAVTILSIESVEDPH